MATTSPRAPRRLILIAGAVALAASSFGAAVVNATPAGPPGSSTSVVLADGTFENTVSIKTGPITFRTRDKVEVFQVSNTGNSGFTSGWHKHTGPVLVNITAGSLTFYDDDCRKTTVSAGNGYIEEAFEPILARNEGSVTAAWITTQIIPVGASRRIDKTHGLCGVL